MVRLAGLPWPSARCKQPRTGPGYRQARPARRRHPGPYRRCDARLARYQAALDAGADPQAVAEWTRQVKTERGAALARDASQNRHTIVRQLTEDDIRALITSLGDVRGIIRAAEPSVKAAVYRQLGLQVTCLPGPGKLQADVTISPEIFAGQTKKYGAMGRVRGANAPKSQYGAVLLTSDFALNALPGPQ